MVGILPAQHAQARQQHRQQRTLGQRAVGVHAVARGVLPEGEHHGQQAERKRAQLFTVGGLGGQPGRQGDVRIGPGQDVQPVDHQIAQEPAVERADRRRGKRPEAGALQGQLVQNFLGVSQHHLPPGSVGNVVVVLQIDDLVIAAQGRAGGDAEIPPPEHEGHRADHGQKPAAPGNFFEVVTLHRSSFPQRDVAQGATLADDDIAFVTARGVDQRLQGGLLFFLGVAVQVQVDARHALGAQFYYHSIRLQFAGRLIPVIVFGAVACAVAEFQRFAVQRAAQQRVVPHFILGAVLEVLHVRQLEDHSALPCRRLDLGHKVLVLLPGLLYGFVLRIVKPPAPRQRPTWICRCAGSAAFLL